jgi:hypothetical protein
MAPSYSISGLAAMPPVPSLSGRFLAHNGQSRVVRAFYAADLHSGAKLLTKPTMVQAAFIARVSPAYAWAAAKRMDQRFEIEFGYVPLMAPAAPVRVNGNGTAHSIVPNAGIDDAELMHIANLVGPDRMLAAAIAAGH